MTTGGRLEDGTPFIAVSNDEMPYPNMEPADLIRWLEAGKPTRWSPGEGS